MTEFPAVALPSLRPLTESILAAARPLAQKRFYFGFIRIPSILQAVAQVLP